MPAGTKNSSLNTHSLEFWIKQFQLCKTYTDNDKCENNF